MRLLPIGIAMLWLCSINSTYAACAKDSAGVDSLGHRYSVYTFDTIQTTFHAPRIYEFGKNLPRDWAEFGRRTVSQKGLITVGALAVSTVALILVDQDVTNGVQLLCAHLVCGANQPIGIHPFPRYSVGPSACFANSLPQ
jgi:hypothetical protein